MDKRQSLIGPIIDFEHNLQIEKKAKIFNLDVELKNISTIKENKYNNVLKTTKTFESNSKIIFKNYFI